MAAWSDHRAVQEVAREVLDELASTIGPDDTERTIAERAVTRLARHGITETWYYECPALVLLGSRSCLSISGRDYRAADEPVGDWNLVTIDLSPSRDGVWGDCARSLFVERGVCRQAPVEPEFRRGADALTTLHAAIREFATPATTFDALFRFGNAEIARLGFENLDFLGNLGHSIVSRREDRIYIESGNERRLGEVPLFTFEPHLRSPGSPWGFKHEEIYRFDGSGALSPL